MSYSRDPGRRVEEKVISEEVLSISGSSDISENDDKITIHSKGEPLPWSKRSAIYDRPLPQVVPRSPSPSQASPDKGQDPFHRGRSPNLNSPNVKSPQGTSPRAIAKGSNADNDTFFERIASPRPSPSPGGASNAGSPLERLPLSASDNRLPRRIVSNSPSSSEEDLPQKASFDENAPSQQGRPLSSFDEEADLQMSGPPPFLGVTIDITSPRSPAHVRTPPFSVVTESIKPTAEENHPDPTHGEEVEETSVVEREKTNVSLGEKRGVSPASTRSGGNSVIGLAPKHVKAEAKVNVQHQQEAEAKSRERLFAKYRNDWKVRRDHPIEQYFFPNLFNPARLEYLTVPKKLQSMPRKHRELPDDNEYPGARYKRDWKVERHFPITRHFDPKLFDPERLERVKVPGDRREKKKRFKERMATLGITDMNSEASRLRRDWQTHRRYPIERFFEPRLFESSTSDGDRLRQDWYVHRAAPVEINANPMLFDESYARKTAKNVHSMLQRLRSGRTDQYKAALKPHYADPGDKYRQDWQTARAGDLLLHWDPSTFDEEDTSSGGATDQPKDVSRSKPEQSSPVKSPLERASQNETQAGGKQPESLQHNRSGTPSFEITYKDESKLKGAPLENKQRGHKSNLINQTLRNIQRLRDRDSAAQASLNGWDFWEMVLSCEELDDEIRQEIYSRVGDADGIGVPDAVRPALWFILSDSGAGSTMKAVYEVNRQRPSAYEQSISEDVFKYSVNWGMSLEETLAMHFILSAYSLHDPETGYSSAMAPLAATLVRQMPEEEAFVVFSSVMQHYDHRRHLQPSAGGCEVLLFQLDRLLCEMDPELAFHLGHFNVEPSSFALEWFSHLCFSADEPLQNALFDLFFLEGYTALHQAALAFVVENRDLLLASEDFATIMSILEGDLLASHSDWSHRDWMALICSISLSSLRLEELEKEFEMSKYVEHERQMIEELAGLELKHDNVLSTLSLFCADVRQICLSREDMAVRLLELQHDHRVLMELHYQQTHQIGELEREMMQLSSSHRDEVRRLTALLNAQQSSGKADGREEKMGQHLRQHVEGSSGERTLKM